MQPAVDPPERQRWPWNLTAAQFAALLAEMKRDNPAFRDLLEMGVRRALRDDEQSSVVETEHANS